MRKLTKRDDFRKFWKFCVFVILRKLKNRRDFRNFGEIGVFVVLRKAAKQVDFRKLHEFCTLLPSLWLGIIYTLPSFFRQVLTKSTNSCIFETYLFSWISFSCIYFHLYIFSEINLSDYASLGDIWFRIYFPVIIYFIALHLFCSSNSILRHFIYVILIFYLKKLTQYESIFRPSILWHKFSQSNNMQSSN